MKRAVCLVIAALFLVSASALPAYSHDRFYFRGGVWIGPGWGGWGPWWWGGPPAYPYYWGPPAVIQENPPVYIQPAPRGDEQIYWYYCPDPRGYYPYVKQCPGGWMRVVPPSAPSDMRE
jgi:hypothetical protein